jgi:hypothetical protein
MVVKHSRHVMIIPTDLPVAAQLGSNPPSPLADNQFTALQQGDRDPTLLRQELNRVRAQLAQQIATLSALDVQHGFALNEVVSYLNSTIAMINRAIDRVR